MSIFLQKLVIHEIHELQECGSLYTCCNNHIILEFEVRMFVILEDLREVILK